MRLGCIVRAGDVRRGSIGVTEVTGRFRRTAGHGESSTLAWAIKRLVAIVRRTCSFDIARTISTLGLVGQNRRAILAHELRSHRLAHYLEERAVGSRRVARAHAGWPIRVGDVAKFGSWKPAVTSVTCGEPRCMPPTRTCVTSLMSDRSDRARQTWERLTWLTFMRFSSSKASLAKLRMPSTRTRSNFTPSRLVPSTTARTHRAPGRASERAKYRTSR